MRIAFVGGGFGIRRVGDRLESQWVAKELVRYLRKPVISLHNNISITNDPPPGSPWPESNASNIVFLLDARDSYERKLLRETAVGVESPHVVEAREAPAPGPVGPEQAALRELLEETGLSQDV